MVAPEDVGAADTREITGGVLVPLLTVTDTPADVAVLPAVSVATAVSVCGPLAAVVVSHDRLYDGPAPVTCAPRLTPSSLNCTPDIPALLAPFAETVVVAETVVPFTGAVIDTVGGDAPAAPDTVNSSI